MNTFTGNTTTRKSLAADIQRRCVHLTTKESVGVARGFYIAMMSQVIASLFFFSQPVLLGWLLSFVSAVPGIAFSFSYLKSGMKNVSAKQEAVILTTFQMAFFWLVIGSIQLVLTVSETVTDSFLKVIL